MKLFESETRLPQMVLTTLAAKRLSCKHQGHLESLYCSGSSQMKAKKPTTFPLATGEGRTKNVRELKRNKKCLFRRALIKLLMADRSAERRMTTSVVCNKKTDDGFVKENSSVLRRQLQPRKELIWSFRIFQSNFKGFLKWQNAHREKWSEFFIGG